jgi:hypothetical protein
VGTSLNGTRLPKGADIRDVYQGLSLYNLLAAILFADKSDSLCHLLSQKLPLVIYPDPPRIIEISNCRLSHKPHMSICEINDGMRRVVYPNNALFLKKSVGFIQGLFDNIAITETVKNITNKPVFSGTMLFQTALTQGIPIKIISDDNIEDWETPDMPKEVRKNINRALKHGNFVLAPVRGVKVNNDMEYVFSQTDSNTGQTRIVSKNIKNGATSQLSELSGPELAIEAAINYGLFVYMGMELDELHILLKNTPQSDIHGLLVISVKYLSATSTLLDISDSVTGKPFVKNPSRRVLDLIAVCLFFEVLMRIVTQI